MISRIDAPHVYLVVWSVSPFGLFGLFGLNWINEIDPYSTTSLTTPAPTVRPPSRIAKRNSFSMAIG
jgi:hypothetical protein